MSFADVITLVHTVSRQNSLALVRVASVLCAKKAGHHLLAWDLLVVRPRRSL